MMIKKDSISINYTIPLKDVANNKMDNDRKIITNELLKKVENGETDEVIYFENIDIVELLYSYDDIKTLVPCR